MRPSSLAVLAILVSAAPVFGQAPLHHRIDQLIAAEHSDYAKVAAPRSTDEAFLRRLTLDLAGVIPSAEDVRAFLADRSPDRRAKRVDHLLASEKHAFHLADTFDVLLMDRRGDKQVKRAEWLGFLRESFKANKPYDQLVREILSADGSDPKARAAARFFLDRDGEPHVLTRDISRLFLGMNLQCAQCHDHPLVNAYKQDHYYGIYAFLSRSYLYSDKASKLTVFAEKGDGDVSFSSVFMTKVTKKTGPRLPDGPALPEPKFDKGQEYIAAIKPGERGIPKFSRRAQLAAKLTGSENSRFARSAVNRVWSMYLGRGLVHPVEYDHEGNPPSHAELLKLLADELIAHNYDLRWLTREILLSETYQRSSAVPPGARAPDPAWFAVAAVRPLSPEQFAWSLLEATGQLGAERKALGAKFTEAALQAKLAPQIATFASLFGGQPGDPSNSQDFEATLDQTLFLRNGGVVRTWLTPNGDNLTGRLLKLKDAAAIGEELYLAALGRRPTVEEQSLIASYLERHTADRAATMPELAWALLSSAEFRFNH
jgi:Protein of unknown function (DUF1553)/Protein of unknown function (DUF1549)